MKLSEAILLGSAIVKPLVGELGKPGGPGCALGMALEAAGRARAYDEVLAQWPWTEACCKPLPCGCWRGWLLRFKMLDAICHLFDHHVLRRGDWTFARLVEWVAAVEPRGAAATPPARKAVPYRQAASIG